jgi:hypothetical protein
VLRARRHFHRPIKHELLFERFVSGERREPPDIDVDFEHERREEIIQWIYNIYGRTRAALTARDAKVIPGLKDHRSINRASPLRS